MVGSSLPRFAAQLLTIRLLLSVLLCYGSSSSNNNVINCPKHERQALLHIIQVKDDANPLYGNNHLLTDSWVLDTNCCQWYGIACDRRTGHVVQINLRNPSPIDYYFYLSLDKSLLALEHLRYLDLSGNTILSATGVPDGLCFPAFIGSFQNLRYLNLSSISFEGGDIPRQLGNLSRLRTLSLMGIYLDFDDPSWLSRLTSLQQVELGDVVTGPGWIQVLSMLPSIRLIRLSASSLGSGGLIPSSLNTLNFTNLSVLDLSGLPENSTTMLPSWLSNLTRLQYLGLMSCNLGGETETALRYLSSSSPSLEVIDLSSNQLQGSIPEDTFLGSMSMLRELKLFYNNLNGSVPQSLGRRLSRLESLDLSHNNFSGSIPQSLGHLSRLVSLDLSYNNFSSSVPQSLGRLTRLESLGLYRNNLSGSIPKSIGCLSRLVELDLTWNNFSGSVPQSLGRLSRLVYLDLSGNSLTGSLTEAHFANLSSLKHLHMSNMNSYIALDVSSAWQPPFRLEDAYLSGCCRVAGGRFPRWLRTQLHSLFSLHISNTGIQDSIPRWFWIDNSSIVDLDLSRNAIFGDLPATLHSSRLAFVDLSSNNLHGPLPQLFNAPNLQNLDLSNNSFSGPISNIEASNLAYLLLSKNNLTGEVPAFICQVNLQILDLSQNHLTGELPDCHRPVFFEVNVLDLSDNNLSGIIPDNLGLGDCGLNSLYLNNNNFSGELPSSLTKCEDLMILDLSSNELTGNIAIWLGDNIANLRTLKLRSNKFYGFLPPMLSQKELLILDLSNNNLAGAIPPSFGSFRSMMTLDALDDKQNIYNFLGFEDKVSLWMKGKEQTYDKLLKFVLAIDLSHSDLSRTIPEQLANLISLQILNLSNNQLIGEITTKIGRMQQLESLDLSYNMLSGPIPPSLSNLDSLGYLDLSYNNLSGRIPTGRHLDTLQNSIMYRGNPFLIIEEHGGDTTIEGAFVGENTDEGIDQKFWLYNSIAPGFVVGIWAVLGPLLFKRTWRDAYFRAMDAVHNKILCR